MNDPSLSRILVHVAAILPAVAGWRLVADFATALVVSLAAFFRVNALGHLAFGPMPTAEDSRRDVESNFRGRD